MTGVLISEISEREREREREYLISEVSYAAAECRADSAEGCSAVRSPPLSGRPAQPGLLCLTPELSGERTVDCRLPSTTQCATWPQTWPIPGLPTSPNLSSNKPAGLKRR